MVLNPAIFGQCMLARLHIEHRKPWNARSSAACTRNRHQRTAPPKAQFGRPSEPNRQSAAEECTRGTARADACRTVRKVTCMHMRSRYAQAQLIYKHACTQMALWDSSTCIHVGVSVRVNACLSTLASVGHSYGWQLQRRTSRGRNGLRSQKRDHTKIWTGTPSHGLGRQGPSPAPRSIAEPDL